MPSIKGIQGPYRLFFYSFDCNERKHVHASRDDMTCKFWLAPVAVAANHGFSSRELTAIRQLLVDNCQALFEAWDEHCGRR